MLGSMLLPTETIAELRTLLGGGTIDGPDEIVAAVKRALTERYELGYAEGRSEGSDDFGEVIDQVTGERRRVGPPTRRAPTVGASTSATILSANSDREGVPPVKPPSIESTSS